MRGKARMSALTTFIQHFTGGPSLYGKARNETKDVQIGKEELQVIIISNIPRIVILK